MTRRFVTLFLIAILCVGLPIACGGKGPAKPNHSFALAFTNDAMGELSDCGCKGGASGGLDRRVGLVEKLSEHNAGNLVTVEAGDFLYAVIPQSDQERAVEAERARIVAEAYAKAKYDAVLFGRLDYALGVEPLRLIGQQMGATILGANVNDAATGQPLWTASTVVERGGVRIGLVGLVTNKTEHMGLPFPLPTGVSIEDPIAVAERIVPTLRKQCDVLVLVANMDRDELKPLLKKVEGVDFVIKSREAKMLTHQVERLAKVPVVGIYELGRYVGELDITFIENGKCFADLEERQILERKIERYREYTDALEKKAGGADKVKEFFANDADKLSRYQRYYANIERWQKELAKLKDKGNRFNYLLTELDDKVPRDEQIAQRVKAFEDLNGNAAAARGRQMEMIKQHGGELTLSNPQGQ